MSAGHRRRIVKSFGWQLAILAIVLAAGRADSADESVVPRHASQAFAAKMEYCQDCHGPSGQGYRGFFPIPRLAGQQIEYIENQLRAFVERRRPNSIMANVAHVLSPGMIAAIAEHFHSLDPEPLRGGPRQLAAAGRKIFEDGVPDANIAACAACHGPDAKGSGQFPRLAGQLYPYVVKALTNWGKERGQISAAPDTSAIMEPVAHSLNKSQIEAVAAFVSELR